MSEQFVIEPLFGETKFIFVDGETAWMVWNGKKWLNYADVYPLIHYASTGCYVDYGNGYVAHLMTAKELAAHTVNQGKPPS